MTLRHPVSIACMHVGMFVCVCAHTFVYTYMYKYMCLPNRCIQNVCMYVCMFMCMHACMYVCMYVCVYVAKMHRMPQVAGLSRKCSINHRALLRKVTYKDKASYASSPPCMYVCMYVYLRMFLGTLFLYDVFIFCMYRLTQH